MVTNTTTCLPIVELWCCYFTQNTVLLMIASFAYRPNLAESQYFSWCLMALLNCKKMFLGNLRNLLRTLPGISTEGTVLNLEALDGVCITQCCRIVKRKPLGFINLCTAFIQTFQTFLQLATTQCWSVYILQQYVTGVPLCWGTQCVACVFKVFDNSVQIIWRLTLLREIKHQGAVCKTSCIANIQNTLICWLIFAS